MGYLYVRYCIRNYECLCKFRKESEEVESGGLPKGSHIPDDVVKKFQILTRT